MGGLQYLPIFFFLNGSLRIGRDTWMGARQLVQKRIHRIGGSPNQYLWRTTTVLRSVTDTLPKVRTIFTSNSSSGNSSGSVDVRICLNSMTVNPTARSLRNS